MSIAKHIKDFLDKNEVAYKSIEHPEEFSAMRIARIQHVPGKDMIKSIIVRADDKYVLCVVSSSQLVDLDKLKKILGANQVTLVSEKEMKDLLPDCEIGAHAPFGVLYNMTTLIDEDLVTNFEVVFNAGSHKDLVRMNAKEYFHLARPTLADIGAPVHESTHV